MATIPGSRFIQGGFIITDDYYYCNSRNYKITHQLGNPVGGHCMTICGWNEDGFIIQNQWGTKFGAKGFCVLPYDLFLKEFVLHVLVLDLVLELSI